MPISIPNFQNSVSKDTLSSCVTYTFNHRSSSIQSTGWPLLKHHIRYFTPLPNLSMYTSSRFPIFDNQHDYNPPTKTRILLWIPYAQQNAYRYLHPDAESHERVLSEFIEGILAWRSLIFGILTARDSANYRSVFAKYRMSGTAAWKLLSNQVI